MTVINSDSSMWFVSPYEITTRPLVDFCLRRSSSWALRVGSTFGNTFLSNVFGTSPLQDENWCITNGAVQALHLKSYLDTYPTSAPATSPWALIRPHLNELNIIIGALIESSDAVCRGEEMWRVEDVPVTFRDVGCAAEALRCSVIWLHLSRVLAS